MIKYNNNISNPGDHVKNYIQFKYVIYQMGQTQNSCGFRHVYNLNIIELSRTCGAPPSIALESEATAFDKMAGVDAVFDC